MARTIVLVRHGKAQGARPGLSDSERSLVPGAVEALAEALPRAFALLDAGDEAARVWVSPALRARQTAEEVVAALDANGVACSEEEREYLFYQDQEAFFDDIEDTPDGSVIVAVGHIPFMEDVLERLTGECISFTPGSVAAVTLPGSPRTQITEGDVLWFVRGPKVAKPRR
ncbi:MAG: histidine phosphatase family protein [Parolsenella sp.]|uniref:SixA phosphatase family protein n=1 Tax=Parolsenella sp. TaxID=2083006 RepID=UPI002A762966|nr:histidine phosphatase family protein [Parolsenella sp.]MCI5949901.1 histidine phosphatase family protein [Coriobacteriaceae bacterium]MDY3291376.1 histidine phosphatase family protein [Parolsenella sp.]